VFERVCIERCLAWSVFFDLPSPFAAGFSLDEGDAPRSPFLTVAAGSVGLILREPPTAFDSGEVFLALGAFVARARSASWHGTEPEVYAYPCKAC